MSCARCGHTKEKHHIADYWFPDWPDGDEDYTMDACEVCYVMGSGGEDDGGCVSYD